MLLIFFNLALPWPPHYSLFFEQLNFENYLSWSRNMKFYLDEKEFWGIVSDTEVKPGDDKKEELVAWTRKCKQVMSGLIFNISSDLKGLISDCVSPSKAWEILKENIVPDSRCQHMMIYNKFLECHLREGETIRNYTNASPT